MRTSSVNFGRAFTTSEMKKWDSIREDAKKALNLRETSMICFDSCMPESKNEDRGLGSSFSKPAQDFVTFMSKMAGVNVIQLEPQGRLAKGTNSPFSGTVFSIGEHIIDTKKLTTDDYAKILPEKDYYKSISYNNDSAEFENVLDDNCANMRNLKIAHENFKQLSETSPLKKEYKTFLKDNADWLEKEALFDCIAEENGDGNWKKWNYVDRHLFTSKIDEKTAQRRIGEIKDKQQDKYEFILFTQFIADKQQSETKKEFNKKGIKIAGDCLIGFSEKEHWANQDAFYENCSLGCEDRHYDNTLKREVIRPVNWGMPALNLEKIGTLENPGPAGKLFIKKFEKFFKRYDSLRIDAAWQLVKPYIVHVDFESGEKERLKTQEQGDKLLKIMDSVLKKTRSNDYKDYNVNLELLGSPIYFEPMFKERCQIHHSVYQHPRWGFVNFYKAKGLGENNFTFGIGTHDDQCLIDIFYNNAKKQAPVLAENLGLDTNRVENSLEEFSNAKFGEIFTTKNNFFTVFDALGAHKRINDQKPGNHNWRARVDVNYEDKYHRNLIQGKGLNLPAAYLNALNAKNIHNPRLETELKLAKAILKQPGPTTTADADNTFGKNHSEL